VRVIEAESARTCRADSMGMVHGATRQSLATFGPANLPDEHLPARRSLAR